MPKKIPLKPNLVEIEDKDGNRHHAHLRGFVFVTTSNPPLTIQKKGTKFIRVISE